MNHPCRLAVTALILFLPLVASATPVSVLLIGDSITVGQQSQPTGVPYVSALADLLGGDFALTEVGCGGTTSKDWTQSQGDVLCGTKVFQLPNLYEARALPNLPADIVTILLGSNDAIGFFEPAPIAPEDYGAYLAEIVDDLLADGADSVILMTPPPNYGNATAQANLVLYRTEVLDLCAEGGGVVCGPDLFTLLEPDDFATGNLHPNAFGHFAIADALEDVILDLVVPEPVTAGLVGWGVVQLALARRRAVVRSRGSRARPRRG